ARLFAVPQACGTGQRDRELPEGSVCRDAGAGPTDKSVIARSAGDPEVAIQSMKRRLRELNPDMVVGNAHSLLWALETQGWGQGRFIATLFSLFAILALALAATGLYSV